MPITINQNKVKFKHPTQQGFIAFDTVASETSQQLQAQLQQKATEIRQSWPENYDNLTSKVNNLVKFQDTAPSTSSTTQVWVDTSSNAAQVAVPTMEDFDDLKSAVNTYLLSNETSPNIYNPQTDEEDVQLYSGGGTGTNTDYNTSDYIDISSLTSLWMCCDIAQGQGTMQFRVCFYDAGKTSLGSGTTTSVTFTNGQEALTEVTIASGAKYIRFHYDNRYVTEIYVGEKIDPYEYVPYGAETIVLPSAETVNARGNYTNLGDRLDALTPRETVNTLVYWGDSLTEGNQAGDGGTIPGSMQTHLHDWTIYNFGRGGDMSNSIACRQGGMNYVVKAGQTIPASGSVTLQITDNIGSENVGVRLFEGLPAWASLNPCSIAGVSGNLTRVSSAYPNNEAIFTRTESGEAVSIDRPTPVVSHGEQYKGFMMVLSGGSNGGFDTSNPSELVNIYRWMVDHANVENYLIMGLYHGKTSTWQANCNKALQAEFGRHYIDAESYMKTPIYQNGEIVSCYALADEGLTATADDITAIANNQYPPQIMNDDDSVHFNKWGYECIAMLQYKRGKELGYWD